MQRGWRRNAETVAAITEPGIDQVLPELSASEVVSYRLGENEQSIEAEIELEIREAPLRELLLRVPKGYAIARLTAGRRRERSLVDRRDRR